MLSRVGVLYVYIKKTVQKQVIKGDLVMSRGKQSDRTRERAKTSQINSE